MTESSAKLAVIILNWNGLPLLKQFLPAAAEYTCSPEADLFVADNGSTDGSVAWVRENFPMVKVIEFDSNYGFAEGYNKAIEATRYPFTLLLNSDVEVTPGWWRPLLDFMTANPRAGAVQPKIKSYHDKSRFEYAGAAGGYIDRLGYPYCRGRLFDLIERDEGQYDGAPVRVAWASGAALTVRTDLYLRLGGLDPLFFAHMEEIDLCCRMQAAGYGVFAISDSEVFHVGGSSLSRENPKKTYLNFRNNLLLLYKNTPVSKRNSLLFRRRLADTLAFFMFMAKFDFRNAKAVLKAHSDYRRMKSNYPDAPDKEILRTLPGADRYIIPERYLFSYFKKHKNRYL